jgi:hypothetical protein
MPPGPTPINKFKDVKFIRLNDNFVIRSLDFYVNNNSLYRYQHYLPLNTNKELRQLAHEIGISNKEINGLSKYELAAYLTQRIEFQIPAELARFERGPAALLKQYVSFPKINIPLSDQVSNMNGYKDIGYNDKNGTTQWYSYPFKASYGKRYMQELCNDIGIMDKDLSRRYTTEELSALLNEKIVLEGRSVTAETANVDEI